MGQGVAFEATTKLLCVYQGRLSQIAAIAEQRIALRTGYKINWALVVFILE
ncbi:hypothetical protein PSOS111911_04695 [Pseudoalteromonas ostreae]